MNQNFIAKIDVKNDIVLYEILLTYHKIHFYIILLQEAIWRISGNMKTSDSRRHRFYIVKAYNP